MCNLTWTLLGICLEKREHDLVCLKNKMVESDASNHYYEKMTSIMAL